MTEINKLVKNAKKGDKEAFVRLMDLHRQALYSVAIAITRNEEDTRDAISETILACWENIPSLRENGHFKSWLTRILINKCYDILSQRKRQVQFIAEIAIEEYDSDTKLQVANFMQSLRENDRLMLSLFYFEDYSIREIADLLQISTGAVKTRLSRSRQNFKEIFLRHEKERSSYENESKA